MLHYQSALLQSLATVFYSVPMVLGFAEEKQIVSINLFEEYVEDSVSIDQYMYICAMAVEGPLDMRMYLNIV